MGGGQCTTNRPTPWPHRFRTGWSPRSRMARSISADSRRTGTPAPATAIAARRASSAASMSGWFSGTAPTFTVSAVSTTQPSTCTPRSSLARSPAWYAVGSSGPAQ